MIPRVYFDTNIFIAAFETAGARADHAWWVLGAAEAGEIDVVTSELTLAELLSKPPYDNPALVAKYDTLISSRSGLEVRPIDRQVLLVAAEIRRASRIVKLPDAIHLATARACQCSHFLSSDLRLRGQSSPIVVPLSPHTLDEIGTTA